MRMTTTMIVSVLVCGGMLSGCSGSWNYPHEATRLVEVEHDRHAHLTIANRLGDVRVVADPGADRILALVELVGRGTSAARAQEALDAIEVVGLSDGETCDLSLAHPVEGDGKQYGARWSVRVPVGVTIGVVGDVGDVVVEGLGADVTVESDVGDVWVRGARSAHLRADVGDVWLSASGDVDLFSDVGDVEVIVLAEVGRGVRAVSDVGDVVLRLPKGWACDIDARTDVGDVRFAGHAELDGDVGEIVLCRSLEYGASPVFVRADVGDIDVRIVEGAPLLPPAPRVHVPSGGTD